MSSCEPASPAPAAFRGSGPFLEIVPSLWLPMRHFAFAAAAFWAFAAAFALGSGRFLGFNFDARWVLGLVHTITLGWITMTILGALTQMLPTHGEIPLQSPWAVSAGWGLFAAGILGFVGVLWARSNSYWIPACLLISGVSLYLYSFTLTLVRAKKFDWTERHFALALAYLASLAALGVMLAYDRQRGVLLRDPGGALIAHVHLALIGWVSLPILGASYRLVYPFALSRLDSKLPGWLALGLANAGLIGLAVDSLFFGHHLLRLWAVLLAAAYLCFVAQIGPLFKGAVKKLDPPLGFVSLAWIGGLVWVGLGLALAFGWIADTTETRSAYVFSALIGWVTPYILGQIHKILPFLVWLHVYSPRQWVPPIRVPKIEDLTSARLAWAELGFLAPAVCCGLAGFLAESPALLRASGVLLLATATTYAVNTGMTLLHVIRRDPQWNAP